ncbi:AraC family transcriptional regulator [Brasilonema octagenarum UFV-E1]|uniref:AraC family transcriptional regulator n=1 Tax=Brasilonema sennae CENA114 TaxID=415709 RepID=A0A856MDG2_9CYAN|nr:lipoxygenase family protein [Brasilonema sennae]QDL08712.1 AraC family transcriptional regulator [Brasilonema sennae CENA114]QDL15068.1 AraC family transcriptional regulator [Brasilonema octagenarum UFV-E1]
MIQPSLPQDDTPEQQQQRNEQIARQREDYQYGETAGILLIKKLPQSEMFSFKYSLERDQGLISLIANTLATNIDNVFDPFDSLKDYQEMFPLLRKPSTLQTFRNDTVFARQRIAGANPMVIERVIEKLPDNFPVTDAIFQKIMLTKKTLAEAIAEGRIFLTNYKGLDGLTPGTYEQGTKTIAAPLVLYCWKPVGYGDYRGTLAPIAIQLNQQTDPAKNPIYTPIDGMHWFMAKIFTQMADGNYHEAISHLGRTHLMLEPFVMATANELAPNHPLSVLLKPHFQFTLAINELAREQLISPGGYADTLLAGTLEASINLIKGAIKESLENFSEFALPKELSRRGVGETDLDEQGENFLPDYPYRDDALLLWRAIESYVSDYLELYYTSPVQILEDTELQNWVRKLISPEGDNVKGLVANGRVESVEQLVAIATQLIFISGPQHGAVNYPQYDYIAFAPNMPLATYAPPPSRDQEIDEATILKILPPQKLAAKQLELMKTLTVFLPNRLGYPDKNFVDVRAQKVLLQFQTKLQEIEQVIHERNQNRLEPYTFLLPSNVPNSLNI